MSEPAAQRWVRHAVSWDLRAASATVAAPTSATWPTVQRRVANERASGLALRAASEGALDATEEQHAWLVAQHDAGLVASLRLDRLLLDLVDDLGRAGVRSVPLKGTVAAHLLYPDPALRLYADVDLLIDPEALGATLEVLRARGGVPARAISDAGLVGATTRGVAVSMPDGTEVDLHTSIAPAGWAPRAPLARCALDDAALVLGGRPVTVLAPAPMALHAALHLLLDHGPRRLVPARDLIAALRRDATVAEEVRRVAGDLGLADLLARGIRRADGALPGVHHPLQAWARAQRAGPVDRAWWWAADRPGVAALALRRVQIAAGLDGWVQKRRYVVGGLRRSS